MTRKHALQRMMMATILISCSPLMAVTSGYVEGFDTQQAADSWWVYKEGGTYYPSWYTASGDPYIYTSFGSAGAWMYADDTSSGGNLVGDYAAAGITALTVEAYCDDPSLLDWLDVYLYSDFDDSYHMLWFEFPTNDWYKLTAAFDDADWWNASTGSPSVLSPQVLSQVTEVGVVSWGIDGTEDRTWINIDNFTAVPEPATAIWMGLGGLLILKRRRG